MTGCALVAPRATMVAKPMLLEEVKSRMILAAGVAARAYREKHPRSFRWVDVSSDLGINFDLLGKGRPMAVATLHVAYKNSRTGREWRERVAGFDGNTIDVALAGLVKGSDAWIFAKGGIAVDPSPAGTEAVLEMPRSSLIHDLSGGQYKVYVPPGVVRAPGSGLVN